MHNALKFLWLPACISAALLLNGCSRNDTPAKQGADTAQDDQIMRELSSEPVRPFAKTANDQHDIQALNDFDQRFTAVSDEMEDELMRMKEQGTLTAEFATERKRDNIQSALNMIKALDLKTEQGRYIQGLLYQYWDGQNQQLQQPNAETGKTAGNTKGLGQFIHAQEQLEHWQSQYPAQPEATQGKTAAE